MTRPPLLDLRNFSLGLLPATIRFQLAFYPGQQFAKPFSDDVRLLQQFIAVDRDSRQIRDCIDERQRCAKPIRLANTFQMVDG